MTIKDLLKKLRPLLPDSQVELNSDGQLIIETGLSVKDGHLVPYVDTYEEFESGWDMLHSSSKTNQ